MSDPSIICPKCGAQVELTKAVTQQVEERLQRQFDAALKAKKREWDEAAEARLAEQKSKFQREALKKAKDAVGEEMTTLREEMEEKNKKLQAAHKREAEMLRAKRDLEEREENLKLEVQRQLDKERKKIRDQAKATVVEEYALKDREHQKQMDDLKKQLEIARRKAEQGSQQAQGEAGELELEDVLLTAFRTDSIAAVQKGKRGGDIIQTVHAPGAKVCGKILWEVKRAQAWSDKWLQKAKDDQRDSKADVAVIVSTVLPAGIAQIGQVGGVWIVNFASATGLATAIRSMLMQVADARDALVGKDEKMELIYEYLSGPKFKSRVEAIAEGFMNMKRDLDTERAQMQRIWARREEQIERVVHNTLRLYGDVEGITGAELPALTALALPELTPESVVAPGKRAGRR